MTDGRKDGQQNFDENSKTIVFLGSFQILGIVVTIGNV